MTCQHPLRAEHLRRWRLILGPYAEDASHGQTSKHGAGEGKVISELNPEDRQRDEMLQYLYGREYQKRGVKSRLGGKGRSRITPSEWLTKVRKLFPKSTAETLCRQALERYALTQLLTDPDILKSATPTMELVKTLMAFRSLLPEKSRQAARVIIRCVVKELEERLSQRVKNAIQGPRNRYLRGGRPCMNNMDWKTTIRRNLHHYNIEVETLILERLYFYDRHKKRLPWDIIILADQSGSMIESVIHSAVLAAIFYSLSSLRTRLILFDTEVVDLTRQIDDPVNVLFGATLGGGTDIGNAMAYAVQYVNNPRRKMVVLITDFYEGGRSDRLEKAVSKLNDSGVTLLGLAALDDRAKPDYNRHLAQRLTALGMEIGAMTPDRLADWVAGVMGR